MAKQAQIKGSDDIAVHSAPRQQSRILLLALEAVKKKSEVTSLHSRYQRHNGARPSRGSRPGGPSLL